MDALVLVARRFEVNKCSIEKWKQDVNEGFDLIIES